MELFRRKGGTEVSGFQKVYEEYSKPVYRFLLTLTRDELMAEELLQETFYRALMHIDQFEGRSSLYTWLCQIGKNAWLKECRKNNRYIMVSMEEVIKNVSREISPEEQVIQKEDSRKIRCAILRLEEPYKDVFILHTYADIKLKEIAMLYGKTESWARVTYYRAKQQIIQEVVS